MRRWLDWRETLLAEKRRFLPSILYLQPVKEGTHGEADSTSCLEPNKNWEAAETPMTVPSSVLLNGMAYIPGVWRPFVWSILALRRST